MRVEIYKKLMAQMILKDISIDDLAMLLGKSKGTIRRRFKKDNGGFFIGEVELIRNTYFPGCRYEDIF